MKLSDTFRFAARAASGYPPRTFLMVLAMAIGIAAIVVLTALRLSAPFFGGDFFAAL